MAQAATNRAGAQIKWTLPLEDLKHIEKHIASIIPEFFQKQVLITGGTGFIGGWLVEFLCYLNLTHQLGMKICVLGRSAEKFQERFGLLKMGSMLEFIQGDVRFFECAGLSFDFIIHSALDATYAQTFAEKILAYQTITNGTERVLQLASQKVDSKFLFLSSGGVYGPSQEKSRISEDELSAPDLRSPIIFYSESKRTAEMLCHLYAEKFRFQLSIARCFAFVGPYLPLDRHFAIGNFLKSALNKTDIEIKSDGSSVRSYLYAADLCIWLLTILLNAPTGEVYNVGSEEEVSVQQLAQLIQSLQPSINVRILGEKQNRSALDRYIPDTKKAARELGLKQWVDIEAALKRTLSWYSQS